MPDPSGLYPQPPQPGAGNMLSDPSKVLGLIGQLNQNALFQQTFGARKALGEAYQKAIRPGGSIDTPTLMREIQRRPDAGFLAGEASQGALSRQGQQTQNATSAFDLRNKQNQFVVDGLGALADKPNVSHEDVRNFVVTASRNTGIPSAILNGWTKSLPRDPMQLRDALVTLRNQAIGSAGLSTPDTTGFNPETGAPVSGTRGQAGYERAGVGVRAAPSAPGIPTAPPGLATTVQGEAEAGQKAAIGLQNAANEIPTQRTQLDLMRKDLKDAETKFGPTAGYEKTANIVANRVLGFHPTMSKEEISGLESFDKVARQIAMSQAGALHATDATLHTALGANPNTNLSAFGNEGIINMLHGNADALAVKAREWNKARKAGVGPDKFYQWSDQFNSSFDPRVFQFMRMSKSEQARLLQTIDDKAEFERHLVDADKSGWIKIPKAK